MADLNSDLNVNADNDLGDDNVTVGSSSTCPDIVGECSLVWLSFPTPQANAVAAWNVGDTQPFIHLQLLDGNGALVNLTGASSISVEFFVPGVPTVVQTLALTLQEDYSLKGERGPTDFTTLNAGRYYARLVATFADGSQVSAPDGGVSAVVLVS